MMDLTALFTWQLIILAFVGVTRGASVWSFEDSVDFREFQILTKSPAPSTENPNKPNYHIPWEYDDGVIQWSSDHSTSQDLGNGDKEEVKEFNTTPLSSTTTTTTFPGNPIKESNYRVDRLKSSEGESVKPSSLYKPIATGLRSQRIQKFPLIGSQLVRDTNFNQEANPADFLMPTQNLQLGQPYRIPFTYVRRTTDEPVFQHRLRNATGPARNSNGESRGQRSKRSADEQSSDDESSSENENAPLEDGDATKDDQSTKTPTPAEALEKLKHLVDKIVRELSQYKQKFTLRLIRMTERDDLRQMPEIMKDFQISPERPIFFITGGLKLDLPEGETTTTTSTTTLDPKTTQATELPTSVAETEEEIDEDTSTPPVATSTETSTVTSLFITNEDAPSSEEIFSMDSLVSELNKDNSHNLQTNQGIPERKRKKRSYFGFEEVELPSDVSPIAGRMARTEDPFEENEPEPFFYEIIPLRNTEVRELGSNTWANYEIIHQSQSHLRDGDGDAQNVEITNPAPILTNIDIAEAANSPDSPKLFESNLETPNTDLHLISQPSSYSEALALVASKNPSVDFAQQTVFEIENGDGDINAKPSLLPSWHTEGKNHIGLSDQKLYGILQTIQTNDEVLNIKPVSSELTQPELQIHPGTAVGDSLEIEGNNSEQQALEMPVNESPNDVLVQMVDSDKEEINLMTTDAHTSVDAPKVPTVQIGGSSAEVNILTSDIKTGTEVKGPIANFEKVSDEYPETSVLSTSGTSANVHIGHGESLPLATNIQLDAMGPAQEQIAPHESVHTVVEVKDQDTSLPLVTVDLNSNKPEQLSIKIDDNHPHFLNSQSVNAPIAEHDVMQNSDMFQEIEGRPVVLETTNPIEIKNSNSELTISESDIQTNEFVPEIPTSPLASNADKISSSESLPPLSVNSDAYQEGLTHESIPTEVEDQNSSSDAADVNSKIPVPTSGQIDDNLPETISDKLMNPDSIIHDSEEEDTEMQTGLLISADTNGIGFNTSSKPPVEGLVETNFSPVPAVLTSQPVNVPSIEGETNENDQILVTPELTNPMESHNLDSELTNPTSDFQEGELEPELQTSPLLLITSKPPDLIPVELSLDSNDHLNVEPMPESENTLTLVPQSMDLESEAQELIIHHNELLSGPQSTAAVSVTSPILPSEKQQSEGSPVSNGNTATLALYPEEVNPPVGQSISQSSVESRNPVSGFTIIQETAPFNPIVDISSPDLEIDQTPLSSIAENAPSTLTSEISNELPIIATSPVKVGLTPDSFLEHEIKTVGKPLSLTKPLVEQAVNIELEDALAHTANPLKDNSSLLSSPVAYSLPQAEVTNALNSNSLIPSSPVLLENPVYMESPFPGPGIDIKEGHSQVPTSFTNPSDPSFPLNPDLKLKVPDASTSIQNIPSTSAFVSYEDPLAHPVSINLESMQPKTPQAVQAAPTIHVDHTDHHPQIGIVQFIKYSMLHPLKITSDYYGPKIISGPTAPPTSILPTDNHHKQQFLHSFFPTLREESSF